MRACLAATICVVALIVAASSAAESTDFLVIRNVQVLTMTEEDSIPVATVTIEGGRIVGVEEGAGEVPEGARVIDGNGKTLMPGLADMHVHHWSGSTGVLYLANSVTTVRNLWGSAQTLILDAAAKRGDMLGPHVYTSGPLMDGPDPVWGEGSIMLTTPEQAIGAVESQRSTGFRAVKLYEGLTPEIFAAAVQAAKDRDMQVWTHVPDSMTIDDVIGLGVDSIEHFEGVSTAANGGSADDGFMARWASADHDRLREIADASAKAGLWHSPTFNVIGVRYRYAADANRFLSRPESDFIGSGIKGWWRNSAERMGDFDDVKQSAVANQLAFARMLYEAGVPMLIGTDTPNPFVLPGYAIHDELAAFLDAGIPVDEVLRMATADAAKFLREEGKWGVVAVDARADLVLLEGDPRRDLSVLRRPAGVMVNGHWADAATLSQAMADLRESVAEGESAATTD